MAHSIIVTDGTNGFGPYTLNFTLGILSRDLIQCRVNEEVDGLGDPVYRDLEWITDGMVNIDSGDEPTALDTVTFTRTMDVEELIHDYTDGATITESNLDESNKQAIMLIHQFLDGRITEPLQNDLDMGDHKIINLADGTDETDAVNLGQLQPVLDVLEDTQALHDETETYRDQALSYKNSADADATATAADRIAVAADKATVASDKATVASDKATVAADKATTEGYKDAAESAAASTANDALSTAADADSTAADAIATAADRVQTGLDAIATAADKISTNADAASTAADVITTAAAVALAEQWAEEAEDVEVTSGHYSAFHWAQKAADFATGDADNISFDDTGLDYVAGADVQSALESVDALVIDEDNMSSNSDTKVPTQQSVKAYVDSLAATGGLTVIASGNLSTGSTSAIDITSIPQTYRGLVLYIRSAKNSATTRGLKVVTDTGAGFVDVSQGMNTVTENSVAKISSTTTLWTITTQTSSQYTTAVVHFPAYQSGPIKKYTADVVTGVTSATDHTASGVFKSAWGCLYDVSVDGTPRTGGITGIRITWDNVSTGVFNNGTYALYGVN